MQIETSVFSKISRNWSLRRYTFVVTGITFLVIGLLVCEFARQKSVRNYYEDFENNAKILTAAIAASAHLDIQSENTQALTHIVDGLVESIPNVKAVAIYNHEDKSLASWSHHVIDDDKKNWSLSSYESDVEHDNNKIGRIAVSFDVSQQKLILKESAINIYLIGIATIVCCAMLVLAMLNHIVMNPVRRIHEHLISIQNNENPGELQIAANKELFYLGNTVSELGNILELRKRKELEVEAVSKAKSDFLANMSHELRTPINGVLGMLSLLSETSLDPQQSEQVRIASSSSKSLLTLINDILDFSKLEAGKLNYENIEFQLETLVEECAEALSESAFRKNLVFLCQIDADVPATVVGDPTRLRQIITNLAGNAIKFTSEGVVKIKVQNCTDSQVSNQIKFIISDTGVGINSDALKGLFKSFAQADSSTTRKFGGTGLGLAISRRIVEGMDGQIGVNSIENEGSTFWFTLHLPAASNDTTLSTNYLTLSRTINVLLVEHIEEAKNNLTRLLLEQNTQVDHVSSATEALNKITESTHSSTPYDVVLFSTQLKDMCARKFCDSISAQKNLDYLKLIAINVVCQAKTNVYTHTNSRISGHISKPARRSAMAEVISLAVLEQDNDRLASFSADAVNVQSGESNSARQALVPTESVVSTDNQPQTTPVDNAMYEDITILVADDNLINQQVAQGMLEALGIQALLADNGREALAILNSERIDLVLMDCQMPILDGYKTTEQIRAGETDTRLPIIALTANTSQGDEEKCYASGMDNFLTKPIDMKILEATIRDALSDRHTHNQALHKAA